MADFDRFDSLSPVDYRYWDSPVAEFLSENGFTRYKLKVELALITVLARRGLCPASAVTEVAQACLQVTTAEVYAEEEVTLHDIRALVNCLASKVSPEARPYIHMTATSYDIIDTANAARYKDVVEQVVVPTLMKLEGVLIDMAIREGDSVQIGRTHGQHAVPITFGFSISHYVSRLGGSIVKLKELASDLEGKFSGAVGAYNASSLWIEDPEGFEADVLKEIGVVPAEQSSQIVPPETLTRLFCELTLTAGIMANLADDMRHLQRTEIGEVGEAFNAKQVGSSTMPQKRNPINFENAKSMWKVIVGRLVTVLLDQLSEHQRDLTNSASGRTYGETIAYLVAMSKRLTRTMSKLSVDHPNLDRNLRVQGSMILTEPLQLILGSLGHPKAYEVVKALTLAAQAEHRPLEQLIQEDTDVQSYFERMTPYQREVLSNPYLYTGIAKKKAKGIAISWKEELGL